MQVHCMQVHSLIEEMEEEVTDGGGSQQGPGRGRLLLLLLLLEPGSKCCVRERMAEDAHSSRLEMGWVWVSEAQVLGLMLEPEMGMAAVRARVMMSTAGVEAGPVERDRLDQGRITYRRQNRLCDDSSKIGVPRDDSGVHRMQVRGRAMHRTRVGLASMAMSGGATWHEEDLKLWGDEGTEVVGQHRLRRNSEE